MTGSDHNKLDDELDDFLAGRDALSRQLAQLQQPEAPARVNDAVMASIAAQLAQEQSAPKLAAITQIAPRPAANMARWRMPAALAASIVGALLLTLEWQRGEYAEPAPIAAQPAPLAVAVPPAEPTVSAAPAAPATPAKPAQPAPKPRPAAKAMPPVLAAETAAPPVIEMPLEELASAPVAARSNSALGYAAAPPAPAPAQVFARAPAPVAAPAPQFPAAVSVTGFARRAELPVDNARANAWLSVIDEMLKAGLHKDALDEWKKFRLAYPDYPVSVELARQIAAID